MKIELQSWDGPHLETYTLPDAPIHKFVSTLMATNRWRSSEEAVYEMVFRLVKQLNEEKVMERPKPPKLVAAGR